MKITCDVQAYYISNEDGDGDWAAFLYWYDNVQFSVGGKHYDDEARHIPAWAKRNGFKYKYVVKVVELVFPE